MFFIRIFRFLTGYIVFTGKNGFPERFLNLCALNGINVWDAKAFNGQLEAKTNISGFRNIQECAKKSGMIIRITNECGMPFIIRPYLNRKGIAAGILISAIITAILSSAVWTIQVNGNIRYTTGQILELAEYYGIYPGAFRNKIDQKAIRENIKATHDSISWFSVNIDGSAVSIDVIELTDDRSKDSAKNSPCNIVSGVDGEILKLDVYTGDAATSVGSAITKGNLLISGVKEKPDGSTEFVHAKGSAIIRTRKTATATVPDTIEISQSELIKKRYSICLLGITIPLGKTEVCDKISTKESMLMYNNITLPVGIITDSYISTSKNQLNLTDNRQMLLCAYSVFRNEATIMHNAETESKNVTLTKSDKSLNITISCINHETSGIESYFVVENKNNTGKHAQ